MSIHKRKRGLYLISTMLAGAVAPFCTGIARAQEAADDSGLTEIVVTAERRAESSQKVPLAIQSISGDTLA
jgi:iron complex outermembrane receptor protein